MKETHIYIIIGMSYFAYSFLFIFIAIMIPGMTNADTYKTKYYLSRLKNKTFY